MKALFAPILALSVLLLSALTAAPSIAGQIGVIHPLGPCGYGKVEKTVCGVRHHPTIKTCRKICVPG